MTTQIEQLKNYLANNNEGISLEIGTKIVDQFGGEEKFLAEYDNVCENGIGGGFDGFIHHADMIPFYNSNKDTLKKLMKNIAEKQGFRSLLEMMDDGLYESDYNIDMIADGLYEEESDNPSAEYITVAEWIVWVAGEHLCHEWSHFCYAQEVKKVS